ncbi:S8 family serine peptidase [Allosphingosinicella flava]|uniref:S8 family serine peptidase n=1 Tax=Allosphingosinicella flava TaxID=2771430 RepID=A0A7T2GL54_9SPHN|nr:S8/S53 family peptidase [Sphingosinicella flava]QPQ55888.1 S8 family serine peptidase [Sphingosinicella flava]
MRFSFLVALLSCLLPLSGAAARDASERPVVAIIDSGVAATRELQPLIVTEYDLGTDRPRTPYAPLYDHGTMVATILARETGHNVGIVSIRIDDAQGCPARGTPPCQADPALIARAIRLATDLGVDAINVSLSLSDDPKIVRAIRRAARRDIPVVLAAGNDGLDHPGNLRSAKAAFPAAVLVGALDAAGLPWEGTNRPTAEQARYVYRWQRGVDVPTALANGAAATATGTSFATPIETARLIKASRTGHAMAKTLSRGDRGRIS